MAFATLGGAASAAELRGWNIHVEDYPVSIAMEAFAAEVAEKTGKDENVVPDDTGLPADTAKPVTPVSAEDS